MSSTKRAPWYISQICLVSVFIMFLTQNLVLNFISLFYWVQNSLGSFDIIFFFFGLDLEVKVNRVINTLPVIELFFVFFSCFCWLFIYCWESSANFLIPSRITTSNELVTEWDLVPGGGQDKSFWAQATKAC